MYNMTQFCVRVFAPVFLSSFSGFYHLSARSFKQNNESQKSILRAFKKMWLNTGNTLKYKKIRLAGVCNLEVCYLCDATLLCTQVSVCPRLWEKRYSATVHDSTGLRVCWVCVCVCVFPNQENRAFVQTEKNIDIWELKEPWRKEGTIVLQA